MQIDDPKVPEFASWRSYKNFARRVRQKRRYVWEPEVTAFLDTVLATVRERDRKISKGRILYRAQHGIEYREDDNGVDILAYGGERMKPLSDCATEGRANPAGIPILYLASSEQTAISEVRPWIGSELRGRGSGGNRQAGGGFGGHTLDLPHRLCRQRRQTTGARSRRNLLWRWRPVGPGLAAMGGRTNHI